MLPLKHAAHPPQILSGVHLRFLIYLALFPVQDQSAKKVYSDRVVPGIFHIFSPGCLHERGLLPRYASDGLVGGVLRHAPGFHRPTDPHEPVCGFLVCRSYRSGICFKAGERASGHDELYLFRDPRLYSRQHNGAHTLIITKQTAGSRSKKRPTS